MKTETKQRIAIFCTGILLAAISATYASAILGMAWQVKRYGWPPSPVGHFPQGMDLFYEAILHGFGVASRFLFAQLMTMIVFHVVRRTPLGTHALVVTVLSFLLVVLAGLTEIIARFISYDFLMGGLCPQICLAVIVAFELLMKEKLRVKIVIGPHLPFLSIWAVMVVLHAVYYASSAIAQAGPSAPEYMRFWGFQFFAFAFFRLPFWIVALAAFFGLRAAYPYWKRKTGSA